MKKRLLSIALTLSLLSGYGLTAFCLADGRSAAVLALEPAAGVLATEELSDYENNQVLVSYVDGSIDVLAYADDAALSEGLAVLSEDAAVALVQPNYTYKNTALSTSDALASQQWALSNDGTFEMEEQENHFPVYDSPFKTPAAPGQWIMPGDFGQPGGRQGQGMVRGKAWYSSLAVQQTTAVAGIDIGAEEAWAVYDGGSREVVVALIDTGIDYTHEDLQNALWVNEDEVAGNGVDDDGNGYIDDVYGWNFYSNNNRIYVGSEDDHGTHGAGTITASAGNGTGIAGIVNSENVKIMSLKALGGKDGSGSTASIIHAIQYAEANGASICNLSLGSDTNDWALYRAIASSSMLFVVASGNDGANTDTAPCYPASYDLDNIISVANLNYDGNLHYSSNYGAKSVDLAAPGTYVLSTTPEDGYSYMTGTSMAAPMVSGAAAMVYSHYEGITLADVKEILLDSAALLNSLTGNTLTGGMLDLGAAMTYNTSALSGQSWAEIEIDMGAAPVIEIEQSEQQGRTVLKIRITDADDDLAVAAYAAGRLDAAAFHGGATGRSFTLDRSGSATFTVSTSGTYTFYARDSMGNETVKAVEISITDQTQTPQMGTGNPYDGVPNGTLPNNPFSGPRFSERQRGR